MRRQLLSIGLLILTGRRAAAELNRLDTVLIS
jgi:hypothetical protein